MQAGKKKRTNIMVLIVGRHALCDHNNYVRNQTTNHLSI